MTTETNEPNGATDNDGFLIPPESTEAAAAIEQAIPAAAAPKKRGRKSNAERAAMAAEQIEEGGPTSKSAIPKSRSNKKTYSQTDIGLMAKQLQGLHQIGAMMLGIPEIQITEGEAVALSQAVVNVSQQYDLEISGKTGALIQIVGTAAMIYVPKIGAISARANANKKAARAAKEANVVASSAAPD